MTDPRTQRFVAQVPALMAELEQRALTLFDLPLSPAMESLSVLEEIAEFLWQMRASFDDQDHRVNILLLGTYLGEVMRRGAGGTWLVEPEAGLPVVILPDGHAFSPMSVVQQRLEAGAPALTGSTSTPP